MDNDTAAYMQRLKEAAQGTFWEYLGSEVKVVEASGVIITLEAQPHHLNQMGILHGGVHAALLDSAMGLAAMISRPEQSVVTTNLNIHFLAPVEKGTLKVTAEILHSSRKLITTQGSVYNADEELCAFGIGTFRVIHPQKGV